MFYIVSPNPSIRFYFVYVRAPVITVQAIS